MTYDATSEARKATADGDLLRASEPAERNPRAAESVELAGDREAEREVSLDGARGDAR